MQNNKRPIGLLQNQVPPTRAALRKQLAERMAREQAARKPSQKSKGEFVMADNATWNKCDVCGKFISMEDFSTGKATRTMVTPDSEFSTEDYETLCPLHNDNNLRKLT